MQLQIIPNKYEELTQRFIAAQCVGKRTKEAYTKSVGYFVEWVQTYNGGTAATKEDILRYKDYLIDQGKKATTVNAYLTAVRRLFEWLESEGIAKNVAKYVKSVKVSKEYKKKPLSDLQWAMLRESLSGADLLSRRDLLLLALGIGNGLRTIEMSRLDFEDIQEQHGRTVAMIEGKGSQAGVKKPVVLNERIVTLLYEYGAALGRTSGAVFTSLSNNKSTGDRISTSGIRYAIKKRFKAVGIDDPMITAHSLRHTHAIKLLEADVPVEKIQQSMRHDNIESTMIYLRSRDLYKDPASLKIDVLAS